MLPSTPRVGILCQQLERHLLRFISAGEPEDEIGALKVDAQLMQEGERDTRIRKAPVAASVAQEEQLTNTLSALQRAGVVRRDIDPQQVATTLYLLSIGAG